MNSTTVINKINDLDFTGFKEAYLRQLEDVNYHNLTFEDRLYNLLDAQYIFLQNKRIERNSKASKIKDKQALVEQIDYSTRRKLDKTNMLSLITMDFIRARQNIIITGTGNETRDFTYVDDTVDGILLAAISNNSINEVFNLGTGKETSIKNIAKMIIEITNSKSKIIFKPKRSFDHINRRKMNISKARKLIKYNPKISIKEGLRKTYDWMLQN